MKKILLTLALITAGYYSYAQNTAWPGPTDVSNVGIGTTLPTAKLDVIGSANFATPSGGYTLSLGGSGGDYGSIGYNQQYGTTSGAYTYKVTDYASFLKFFLGGFDFLTANSGTAGSAISYTNVMRITQAGNVGIGTTAPRSLLDVAGALSVTGETGLPSSGVGIELSYQTSASQGRLIAYDRSNSAYKYLNINDNMFVAGASGNVGIGTTTPDTKLAVNGTIHSKEVKVDLVGWPDYVFKPTYSLASLKDVKIYIDQNHHLPDMPSEQQVAKEGLNLGDMNAKLLKKVEELTLYLIEENKKNAAQKETIDRQEERLQRLEKLVANSETKN